MAEAKDSHPKLRTVIRQVYSDLKKDGKKRISIYQIRDKIVQNYSKLVEIEKERLFRDAISDWIRQTLKSGSSSLRAKQLSLPLDLGPVYLPLCISIRSIGRSVGEAEWVEPYDISFAELCQEIAKRTETVTIKQVKELRSLEKLKEYLAPYMERTPDDPVGLVLERPKEQSEKEKTGK